MNTAPDIIHTKYEILSAEHPAEAILLRGSAWLLALSICLYLYFVSASVLNVIARADAQRDASLLEGAVGTLQQEYFTLAESVSAHEASAHGLTPVAATSYVRRPSAVGVALPAGTQGSPQGVSDNAL